MRQFAFATLAADSALCALIGGSSNPRIFQGKGAQGALFPQVQIRYISPIGGGDFRTLNYERVWTRARFLIVAVGDARSYTKVYPIATALDELLEKKSGTATGGKVHYFVSEAPYDRSYEEDGVSYTESGRYWEIAAS